ncbi:hypothetical protein ABZ671_17150 [Micromonospora sp. NPDC006766]|uniref:hypothetical protein n=1 Tax=Micromonospora sp. NPDC006766 TaxID=3154778 RepID=UPI0033FAE9AE
MDLIPGGGVDLPGIRSAESIGVSAGSANLMLDGGDILGTGGEVRGGVAQGGGGGGEVGRRGADPVDGAGDGAGAVVVSAWAVMRWRWRRLGRR